jgi:hypothetical protein
MSHTKWLVGKEDWRMAEPVRAADLAAMLGRDIFDLDDAAAFLGVVPGTLWQQVARRRIAYVQYKNHKYFAFSDLCDYATVRGKGRKSGLDSTDGIEVTGGINRAIQAVPRVP